MQIFFNILTKKQVFGIFSPVSVGPGSENDSFHADLHIGVLR